MEDIMEFNCALEGKEIRRKYKKFVLGCPGTAGAKRICDGFGW